MKIIFLFLIFILNNSTIKSLEINGLYKSSYGDILFEQNNNTINATYEINNGKISGIIKDNTLIGTWEQSNSKGKLIFEFSKDGKSFEGKWNYNEAIPSIPWNGEILSNYLNIEGVYETNFNKMTLKQKNNVISGTYEFRDGKIKGTINGNILTGAWEQSNAHGKFIFEFNENGETFSGKWNYGDAEPTRSTWNGRKKE